MLKHKDHFHGSDLEKIEAIYGIKKEDIISFSANVNPLGISPLLKEHLANHISVIESYPDREYTALRKSIADYTKGDFDHILVGSGTTELISLVIELRRPKKAFILGPSYSEYERSISLCGGSCVYYPLQEAHDFQLQIDDFISHLTDDMDFLILCNPNNPTGTAIANKDLRRILNACMEHGIFVMIDETYIEFATDISKYEAISLTFDYNNLIVLRGISKFFAAPGLRLGYAVTGNQEIIQKYKTSSNPWSINSLAALAGEVMFQDQEYIQKTRDLIQKERTYCYEFLSKEKDFQPFAPVANFMLVRLCNPKLSANDLFERCIQKGLMIRNCTTFPFLDEHFVRFCFMKPEDNRTLLQTFVETNREFS